MVVDKPIGVSVHNNEEKLNLMARVSSELKVDELFPVHRLDKETSGVQILALNKSEAARLAGEFESRKVSKIYYGVCRGMLKQKSGVWNWSLSDKAEGRKNPQGMSYSRVPSETHFKVLKQNQYFSLVEFDLKTGRQHQIRKHAALSNHPIVGDLRYGELKYNSKIFSLYKLERMFLHCYRIKISSQAWESPIPEEFERLV